MPFNVHQADYRAPEAAAGLRSGKGHHDENFPVASLLIKPELRKPSLAF